MGKHGCFTNSNQDKKKLHEWLQHRFSIRQSLKILLHHILLLVKIKGINMIVVPTSGMSQTDVNFNAEAMVEIIHFNIYFIIVIWFSYKLYDFLIGILFGLFNPFLSLPSLHWYHWLLLLLHNANHN